QERWRDWPFEASATDLRKYCANSRSVMLEDKKSEQYTSIQTSSYHMKRSFYFGQFFIFQGGKVMTKRSLEERLKDGPVIVGEGYLFELERRGYLQAGSFVPEVALENPEALKQTYRDYMNSGSDVVLAFTYNAHREKMRIIGKDDLLEPLNRRAIQLAKEVAKEHPEEEALVAGNISNTNIFDDEDPESKESVRNMFAEMVSWCKDEGVDFVNGETFYYH